MAGRGFLGCVGATVGVLAALVVGWLSLDLMLTVWGALSGRGLIGPLLDATVWHQLGQLAIFVGLIGAILVVVLSPHRAAGSLPALRVLLWAGAALEIAAWLALPGGSRIGVWALLLAILALPAPWVVGRIVPSEPAPGDC